MAIGGIDVGPFRDVVAVEGIGGYLWSQNRVNHSVATIELLSPSLDVWSIPGGQEAPPGNMGQPCVDLTNDIWYSMLFSPLGGQTIYKFVISDLSWSFFQPEPIDSTNGGNFFASDIITSQGNRALLYKSSQAPDPPGIYWWTPGGDAVELVELTDLFNRRYTFQNHSTSIWDEPNSRLLGSGNVTDTMNYEPVVWSVTSSGILTELWKAPSDYWTNVFGLQTAPQCLAIDDDGTWFFFLRKPGATVGSSFWWLCSYDGTTFTELQSLEFNNLGTPYNGIWDADRSLYLISSLSDARLDSWDGVVYAEFADNRTRAGGSLAITTTGPRNNAVAQAVTIIRSALLFTRCGFAQAPPFAHSFVIREATLPTPCLASNDPSFINNRTVGWRIAFNNEIIWDGEITIRFEGLSSGFIYTETFSCFDEINTLSTEGWELRTTPVAQTPCPGIFYKSVDATKISGNNPGRWQAIDIWFSGPDNSSDPNYPDNRNLPFIDNEKILATFL